MRLASASPLLTNRLAFLAALGESDAVLEASDEALLAGLERRLDARAFRAAAQLAQRWHHRRRPLPTKSSPALASDTPTALLPALRRAMLLGALESAEQLVDRALAASPLLDDADANDQALCLETLLMLGRDALARTMAEPWHPRLLRSANGSAMLELLGMSAPDMLPDGRVHALRLSRRLSRGELDAAGLLRLLGTSPFPFLRSPDLYLLLFSALLSHAPERGLGFLNRFLTLHGSPRARLREGTGNVLERLTFDASAPPRGATPLVSVLVPAHDAELTIDYAVDSLLGQSHSNLEVLVGDDASADATLSRLRARARDDSRLRLFRSAHNQGPYNLKNALARHAHGELLTFHDADDLALPDRIARQVEAMQSSASVACIANFARLTPAGSFVFFKDQKAVRLGMVTLMLTRAAFDAVGPFRSARIGSDLELFAAVKAHFGPGAIARVRSPVMLGLWSPSSATQGPGRESLATGYRSPARRAYSQLVYEHHGGRQPAAVAAEINQRLRATGNQVDAADVHEVL